MTQLNMLLCDFARMYTCTRNNATTFASLINGFKKGTSFGTEITNSHLSITDQERLERTRRPLARGKGCHREEADCFCKVRSQKANQRDGA